MRGIGLTTKNAKATKGAEGMGAGVLPAAAAVGLTGRVRLLLSVMSIPGHVIDLIDRFGRDRDAYRPTSSGLDASGAFGKGSDVARESDKAGGDHDQARATFPFLPPPRCLPNGIRHRFYPESSLDRINRIDRPRDGRRAANRGGTPFCAGDHIESRDHLLGRMDC